MKKVVLMLMILLMLGACGKKEEKVVDENVVHLGVLQLMDHEALNSAYEGFLDALKEGGYIEGENLVIEYQNPNNDKSSLATMAQLLVNQESDLILAIGTGAAQALQQETDSIPVLGMAITDYIDVGLVKSNEEPGANISGSSDFVDMEVQMDLVEQILPEVKNIGLLYTSSEENSIVQAIQMKKECEKRGWNVVEKTISDLTMVNDTMESFIGDVDILYIPTDNPLASSMASVEIVASEHKLPVVVGWDSGVKDGALASVGVNYYNLGYQTGLNAIKVLEGEVSVDKLPIYFMDSENADVYYNAKTAEKIGITLSEEILTKGIDLSH